MSSRDYAVEDYGIVLTMIDMKSICMRSFQDCTEAAWEEDPYGFIDELRDAIDLCYCGDITGEAFAVGTDGRDQYHDSITFSGEQIYYLGIRKYPTLFRGAYQCFDEMVADLKDAMGKYAPDGFDFSNVRHIIGTYFG